MRGIPLGNGTAAMVDDADFARVSDYPWRPHTKGYAQTSASRFGCRGVVLMHRFVMDAKPGQILDHIDGNRLNNTRANLRFCTTTQSIANQRKRVTATGSRFKGVSPKPRRGRMYWEVVAGEYVGTYKTELDAARAYDTAALLRYGAFARLNFPEMAGAA